MIQSCSYRPNKFFLLKKTSTQVLAAVFAGLCIVTVTSATAQTKEALYTASLSATCAACHGTQGMATSGSAVLPLAGLQKEYFIAQMNAFQTGARAATVMHQISKGYSAAQIEQMATYFAVQKK